MAVPPVIPTSFVPHPSNGGNSRSGLGSVLATLAYLFLVLALLSAGGVYLYNGLLASQRASKDAQLAKATSSLDQATIEQFLRLRDRLVSAGTLLDNHTALSGLFDLLESVTPQSVDFSSVNVSIDAQGNTVLVANGTARSFNSLAAASNDFSAASGLKNTIFSNLSIAYNGSVGFVLSATLDPKLIAYTGSAAPVQAAPVTSAQPVVPVSGGAATSSPATTTKP